MSRPAYRRLLVSLAAFLLVGCAGLGHRVDDNVSPRMAGEELAGPELLDVAIRIFDSEELTDDDIEDLGLSPQIREAEERFVPIHLKYTLQRTGYWGAVRVVPEANHAHLQVTGAITYSDGERLDLAIKAVDARGITWFEESYSETLRLAEHSRTEAGRRDPFQDLYNTIANDLVAFRLALSPEDLEEIHRVAELRFAHEMAPDAFDGHLEVDDDGRYALLRLPVTDDPMLTRVQAIATRDAMLLDTVHNYYDAYYQDLWQPYADWRRLRSEETEAMREVEKQALTRQLLGLAAIVGGVLLNSSDNSVSTSGLPQVMVIGGAAAVYSGFEKWGETKIHKEVIEELSVSFAAEAEPLVVEVIGETVRLTGSAEEQYRQWRAMLREIYAAETGFPLDEELMAHPDADGAPEPLLQERP